MKAILDFKDSTKLNFGPRISVTRIFTARLIAKPDCTRVLQIDETIRIFLLQKMRRYSKWEANSLWVNTLNYSPKKSHRIARKISGMIVLSCGKLIFVQKNQNLSKQWGTLLWVFCGHYGWHRLEQFPTSSSGSLHLWKKFRKRCRFMFLSLNCS